MRQRHTPGPWESSQNLIYKVARETADRTRIAVVNQDTEESFADARLIAAAPELLEAAQEMLQAIFLGKDDLYEEAKISLALAVSKATGGAE